MLKKSWNNLGKRSFLSIKNAMSLKIRQNYMNAIFSSPPTAVDTHKTLISVDNFRFSEVQSPRIVKLLKGDTEEVNKAIGHLVNLGSNISINIGEQIQSLQNIVNLVDVCSFLPLLVQKKLNSVIIHTLIIQIELLKNPFHAMSKENIWQNIAIKLILDTPDAVEHSDMVSLFELVVDVSKHVVKTHEYYSLDSVTTTFFLIYCFSKYRNLKNFELQQDIHQLIVTKQFQNFKKSSDQELKILLFSSLIDKVDEMQQGSLNINYIWKPEFNASIVDLLAKLVGLQEQKLSRIHQDLLDTIQKSSLYTLQELPVEFTDYQKNEKNILSLALVTNNHLLLLKKQNPDYKHIYERQELSNTACLVKVIEHEHRHFIFKVLSNLLQTIKLDGAAVNYDYKLIMLKRVKGLLNQDSELKYPSNKILDIFRVLEDLELQNYLLCKPFYPKQNSLYTTLSAVSNPLCSIDSVEGYEDLLTRAHQIKWSIINSVLFGESLDCGFESFNQKMVSKFGLNEVQQLSILDITYLSEILLVLSSVIQFSPNISRNLTIDYTERLFWVCKKEVLNPQRKKVLFRCWK